MLAGAIFATPSPTLAIASGSAWRAVPIVAAVFLFALFPAAAANAWQRFLLPWKNAPRYTFTMLEPLPGTIVVPHGEPFSIALNLKNNTAWRPRQAVARVGAQHPVIAPLRDSRYDFELPPRIDAGWLDITVGDAAQHVRIEPTLRPELTSVVASVSLPEYLGRPETLQKDVRGGAISLVLGSRSTFTATASRELRSAQVDGQSVAPAGARVTTAPAKVEGSRKMEFRWQDEFGLAGKEPFVLAIAGREDEGPSLACEDLPRQKVVLDTELLSFKIRGPGRFRYQADRHRLAGRRQPDRQHAGEGRAHSVGGGPRKGIARDQRDFLGPVAGDRAAARPGADLRGGLSSRA